MCFFCDIEECAKKKERIKDKRQRLDLGERESENKHNKTGVNL